MWPPSSSQQWDRIDQANDVLTNARSRGSRSGRAGARCTRRGRSRPGRTALARPWVGRNSLFEAGAGAVTTLRSEDAPCSPPPTRNTCCKIHAPGEEAEDPAALLVDRAPGADHPPAVAHDGQRDLGSMARADGRHLGERPGPAGRRRRRRSPICRPDAARRVPLSRRRRSPSGRCDGAPLTANTTNRMTKARRTSSAARPWRRKSGATRFPVAARHYASGAVPPRCPRARARPVSSRARGLRGADVALELGVRAARLGVSSARRGPAERRRRPARGPVALARRDPRRRAGRGRMDDSSPGSGRGRRAGSSRSCSSLCASPSRAPAGRRWPSCAATSERPWQPKWPSSCTKMIRTSEGHDEQVMRLPRL